MLILKARLQTGCGFTVITFAFKFANNFAFMLDAKCIREAVYILLALVHK